MSKNCGLWCLAVLFVLVGCLYAAAPAEAAEASNCARCSSCSSCGMSGWGGASCDFSSGCCNETGGNCNPQIALEQNLLLKPVGLVVAETPDGAIELAQLSTGEHVTWSCQEQDYVVYRRAESGAFEPVELLAG